MNIRLLTATLVSAFTLSACVSHQQVEYTSFHDRYFSSRDHAEMQNRTTAELFLDGYLLLGYMDLRRNIQTCYGYGNCTVHNDIALSGEELSKEAAKRGGDVVSLLEETSVVVPVVSSYCISSYTQMIQSGDSQIPIFICSGYSYNYGKQEREISRALIWRYDPEAALSDANTEAIEAALTTLASMIEEEVKIAEAEVAAVQEQENPGQALKKEIESAIVNEDLQLLEKYYESGDLDSWRDEDERTALMYAIYKHSFDVARMILKLNPGLNDLDKFENNVLVYAIANGDVEFLEEVLAAGYQITPYHGSDTPTIFFATDNPEIFYWLVNRNSDLNLRSDSKTTVLHSAAGKGNQEVVGYLLAKQMDPNLRNHSEVTPLMTAAFEGRVEVMEQLLAAGADINAESDSKSTSLHYAALSNDVNSVRLLLDRGLDINAEDVNGRTPLVDAITGEKWRTSNFLVAEGAKLTTEMMLPERLAYTLIDKDNYYLLEHYLKNIEELRVAVEDKNKYFLVYAMNQANRQVIEKLLKYNAPVNAQDGRGISALMIAARTGNIELVNIFLNAGADTELQDSFGGTAVNAALSNGHGEIVALLRKHGAQ